jgi:hypothetical protein
MIYNACFAATLSIKSCHSAQVTQVEWEELNVSTSLLLLIHFHLDSLSGAAVSVADGTGLLKCVAEAEIMCDHVRRVQCEPVSQTEQAEHGYSIAAVRITPQVNLAGQRRPVTPTAALGRTPHNAASALATGIAEEATESGHLI